MGCVGNVRVDYLQFWTMMAVVCAIEDYVGRPFPKCFKYTN